MKLDLFHNIETKNSKEKKMPKQLNVY